MIYHCEICSINESHLSHLKQQNADLRENLKDAMELVESMKHVISIIEQFYSPKNDGKIPSEGH